MYCTVGPCSVYNHDPSVPVMDKTVLRLSLFERTTEETARDCNGYRGCLLLPNRQAHMKALSSPKIHFRNFEINVEILFRIN